ncbi:hypothetical protein E2C01_068799 [Portunus trituberculatus]|uniref:Uncharacterized protein n=1 Tax=Portunus trituberculatus TaxID=210409 RepID=A0A5B7HPS2_PORTR|nr:hypothetical protein [Portunus trituberculatus]
MEPWWCFPGVRARAHPYPVPKAKATPTLLPCGLGDMEERQPVYTSSATRISVQTGSQEEIWQQSTFERR